MFSKHLKKETRPISGDLERPAGVTLRFLEAAKVILSKSSTSDNEGQEAVQPGVEFQEQDVATDIEQSKRADIAEIDLSFKGLSGAVAEARRDGTFGGHVPPVY